jgi:parallel beta-helix repeat protein
MVGMHKGSEGSVFFGDGSGALVTNNTITNAGKTGIFLGSNKGGLAKNNTVDGACLIHGDCGGIYTFTTNTTPLNIRIENNRISNVNGAITGPWGPLRFGIYLDHKSSGVTVIGNTLTTNNSGLLTHGFDNTITQNTFSGNISEHIWYAYDGNLFNTTVSFNAFVGPVLAHRLTGANDPATYATFVGNTYTNYGGNPIGDPPYLSY